MIDLQFPLDFWTHEPIVFEVDNENYVNMDKLDRANDTFKFIGKIVKKYTFEQGTEFEKKEFWFLMKFFFINSKFHPIDTTGMSILNGGVPSKLKMKCTCGNTLDEFKWLKGYCPPPLAMTVHKDLPDHEYFLRISNPCPSCNTIICIYRPKAGVYSPLMIFLDFLLPTQDFHIFDPSLFTQWLMVVSKVLEIEDVSLLYREDIIKIINLIDENPNLDEEYKQASKFRFNQAL